MNESHPQHHACGPPAEPVVTLEQLEDWSAEIHAFLAHTRQRLTNCGGTAAESEMIHSIRQVISAEDPREQRALDRAAKNDALATGASTENREEGAAPDDALSRLHEIQRRLAARLQNP